MALRLNSHTQKDRAPPPPLVDTERKLILFWMHRCGSTTGQLWFFRVVGWDFEKAASQLAPIWFEEHADVYADLTPYYNDPSFVKVAVVRDPLIRAVSAYSVVTDSKSGVQWRAVARSLETPDPERRITFNEFLDYLESIDLAGANYHWRLQTASDWYDLSLPNVHFARVERIQEDLDAVCAKMGIAPVPVRVNSAMTKVAADVSKVDLPNLTRADLARLYGRDRRGVIRFPDYAHFLTPETTVRLAKLYARDFDVLGYDPAAERTVQETPSGWLKWLRRS